jgi:carboxyl-terminal processing protease
MLKLLYPPTFLRQIAFLILLVLVGAAPAPGAASSHQRAARAATARSHAALDSLSSKDRVEVFEEVWEEIDEKYYDPGFNGVNWRAVRERYRPLVDAARTDDEFYALLKKMVGELRDAHTRFHTPRERREREQLQGVGTGVSIYEVEGKPVILGVDGESEASRAGVEPGMIVLTIDGKPVAERIAAAQSDNIGSSSERAVRLRVFRKILAGEPGTSVTLGLMRADASSFTVTLTRRMMSDAPRVSYQVLRSGYGYLKLNLWKSPIHKEFKQALEKLKDTPGLIIDLRGNPGGEVNEVLKIASYFFRQKVSFGQFVTRSGRMLELYAGREGDQVYSGAVAILVNEASGSGSEMFAGVLQESGRALVIGRQSCGCLLGIAKFRKVEGGGELAISELGYVSPKGRRLEGSGVMPDGTVALKIADLQRRRDAVIEEAESALRAPIKSATSQR